MSDRLNTRPALAEENPALKRLLDKHAECESRLQQLSALVYLSDAEQLEQSTLKKQKLALKDQMEACIRKAGS